MSAGAADRKRILIAEDDPAISDLLSRALSKSYDVAVTRDGSAALAAASAPPHPHLILLDVMMPVIDGFGVARRMRLIPELKHVPIIFITAKDHPLDQIKGIQSGARHYITKPFKLKDVLDKVQKAIGV